MLGNPRHRRQWWKVCYITTTDEKTLFTSESPWKVDVSALWQRVFSGHTHTQKYGEGCFWHALPLKMRRPPEGSGQAVTNEVLIDFINNMDLDERWWDGSMRTEERVNVNWKLKVDKQSREAIFTTKGKGKLENKLSVSSLSFHRDNLWFYLIYDSWITDVLFPNQTRLWIQQLCDQTSDPVSDLCLFPCAVLPFTSKGLQWKQRSRFHFTVLQFFSRQLHDLFV